MDFSVRWAHFVSLLLRATPESGQPSDKKGATRSSKLLGPKLQVTEWLRRWLGAFKASEGHRRETSQIKILVCAITTFSKPFQWEELKSEDRFQKLFKHLKRQWGSSCYFLKKPIYVPELPQVPQYTCSWKPPDMAEPDIKGHTQFEPCYHMD